MRQVVLELGAQVDVRKRLEPASQFEVGRLQGHLRVLLVEGFTQPGVLAGVGAVREHDVGVQELPEAEQSLQPLGEVRRHLGPRAFVREQRVVAQVRVFGKLLEHESDGERPPTVRRECAADRILIAEITLRHAAADRDRIGLRERRARIAVDDLVCEHLEHVLVGEVDVVPIRALVFVTEQLGVRPGSSAEADE